MQSTREKIFTFDELEEVVEQYYDESEETANAVISFNEGIIVLTTCKFKDCEVKVYRVKESPELYAKMDEDYLLLLEDGTSGSDFWDKWNAIIYTLQDFCIVDDVLNP